MNVTNNIPNSFQTANAVVVGLCDYCGCKGAARRRQNTAYVNDERNWAILCPLCQDANDDYWRERWDEYYASVY